ncbi:haloacid dehalogenase superfamily, subfamily IA, variant 3 with third motif having DD or ED [Micromonospora haikouensis]|uniref:Haloacid dehalogenase superfamily, subfamily IA, variant 3 with third motif having DD or ED n=1 Tax=Micromonospora haikouensis TaxID=686309 RepID=A0A1C4XXR9_9ACTN|nr:HAD family phosphatase [Micromonospora haikouensis]SCF13273.1 haloacid dehalogenase superfamily, subfamily IA, variant 3 with third motif having DD or ED [Micromonospora haikouensis]
MTMPSGTLSGPDYVGCLIFDWDGTLVDTQSANYRAMSGMLAGYGIDVTEPWFVAHAGVSSAEMIEMLVKAHGRGLPVSTAQAVRERDALFLSQLDTVAVKSPVVDVALRNRGRVPLAVASGGSRAVIQAGMRATGLDGLFDVLVAREDVVAGKPAPDLFLLAAEQLQTDPELCLVFEDSDDGVLAAERAGMAVIDIRTTTPPWRVVTGVS